MVYMKSRLIINITWYIDDLKGLPVSVFPEQIIIEI